MRVLLEALEKLYTPVLPADFPVHFFSVLAALVPDVVLSLDDLDLRTRKVVSCVNRTIPNEADYRATIAINLPRDHPGMAYLQAGGKERFWRLTDFISQRQFRQTGLYADQFKPLDIAYQLSVMLDVPDHIVGVSVNRKTDFTEKEITLIRQITPHAARAYANAQLFGELSAKAAHVIAASSEGKAPPDLTPREMEVLHWLAEGKRNIEIGLILGISPRTIGKHVENILAKLDVETRTAAVALAANLLKWR